jgi:uncharacterized protein (TIGR02147 family)
VKKAELHEIVRKEVKPSSYMDYRLFFRAVYEFRKKRGDYSYPKFAEDLGFKATSIMHHIVHGTRPLTLKTVKKIIDILDMEKVEALYLETLVAFAGAKDSIERQVHFEQLQNLKRKTLPHEIDRDLLEYFSVWYNPVIWGLVGSSQFQADPQWIAKRIIPHLKPSQAKESLELLERLKLIELDEETKTYKQTTHRVSTGHRVKGMALVSFHSSMIDHAKAALTSISGERRDVSSVTVNVSEETAKKLRAMIHSFQLQLLDEAERAGSGDQVYQINIQLFPFTE